MYTQKLGILYLIKASFELINVDVFLGFLATKEAETWTDQSHWVPPYKCQRPKPLSDPVSSVRLQLSLEESFQTTFHKERKETVALSILKTFSQLDWSFLQKPRTELSQTTLAAAVAAPPRLLPKSSEPPQNLCRSLKTFTCVSLRYIKHQGGGNSGSHLS